MTDPKDIVRKGYDALGDRYVDGPWDKDEYFDWLDELVSVLKPDTNILELGCNVGVPTTRRLSATHQVTGVDLSPVAVSLARANVPDATFVVGDMSEVDFPDRAFSAVVAFYSIPHLPLEEQPSGPTSLK